MLGQILDSVHSVPFSILRVGLEKGSILLARGSECEWGPLKASRLGPTPSQWGTHFVRAAKIAKKSSPWAARPHRANSLGPGPDEQSPSQMCRPPPSAFGAG